MPNESLVQYPLRKRLVVQLRDTTAMIAGIFDPTVHTLRPMIALHYRQRIVLAHFIRSTTRILWYREQE